MSDGPTGIVCSVCGNMFRDALAEEQAKALSTSLLQHHGIAPALLHEQPGAGPQGICTECYQRLLQWARDFGLRE